jgi:hypothetical protein
VYARLRQIDNLLRARHAPLRLALRVRSYLGFVLRRRVGREQTELLNGGRGARGWAV